MWKRAEPVIFYTTVTSKLGGLSSEGRFAS